MAFESRVGIGLAPYPSTDEVNARIESARRWRNDTVRSAVMSPLLLLARLMRANDTEAVSSAPTAGPVRPALSPRRSAALLLRSAIVGVLLVAGLCASAFVDHGQDRLAGNRAECLEPDAEAVDRLKQLLDRTSHHATMAATGALRQIAAARVQCANGSVDRAMDFYRDASWTMTRFHDGKTLPGR